MRSHTARQVEAAVAKARLDEITDAWQNACLHSSATGICLSLSQRRKYLEAQLSPDTGQGEPGEVKHG
jgi:hypothetical protein